MLNELMAVWDVNEKRTEVLRKKLQTLVPSASNEVIQALLGIVKFECDFTIVEFTRLLEAAQKQPLPEHLDALMADLVARSWRGASTKDQLHLLVRAAIEHGGTHGKA